MPDNIGVLAPGGGTQGMTPAGQAELTHQRTANMSLPTRALGIALGAAETIVPAAGSPKETLRTLAKAARDYIVSGVERGFMRTSFDAGHATGAAAKAGDPHAQGAAIATVAATAAGAAALYGRAASALPPRMRLAVDLTPLPKPPPDPLNVPAYQRRPTPNITQRFPTDQDVRADALYRRGLQRKEVFDMDAFKKKFEGLLDKQDGDIKDALRGAMGPPETWSPIDWEQTHKFFNADEPWSAEAQSLDKYITHFFGPQKVPWYNNPHVVAGLQKMQADLNSLPRLVAKPGYEVAVPPEPITAKLTGVRVRRKNGYD